MGERWTPTRADDPNAVGAARWRGLDARGKLAGGFLFAGAVFLVRQPSGLAWLALCAATAVASAALPWRHVAGALRAVSFVVLLSSGLHLLFTPGTALWSTPLWTVTREGLAGAGWLAARVFLVVAGLQVVTSTTSPSAMREAVRWWLRPGASVGLPVEELSVMLTVALTFAPVLQDEYGRIVAAQAARGAPLDDPNPLRRAGAVVPVVLPLFAGVLRRADELTEAMESRGYGAGFGPGRRRPAPWKAGEALAFLAAAALFLWIGWRYR